MPGLRSSFCPHFACFLCKLVYFAQNNMEKIYFLTNTMGLHFAFLYDIIARLDMRRSERLLRGDACVGNFRGVCPLTGRKVFTEARKTARTRAALPYSQLLNSPEFVLPGMLPGRQTPFLSERGRNPRNSVVGNACLANCILQADGFHFIYNRRRRQAKSIRRQVNGSHRKDQSQTEELRPRFG